MTDRVSVTAGFKADLGDIPIIDDPALVKLKSRDFYWYSPILKAELKDLTADLIVQPRNEDDIVRIAAACAKHRVPLTQRGAGTGNYGQAMPLAGGVVMELLALDKVLSVKDGILRVQCGKKMTEIDRELRPQGWELRMFPSTKRTATIGGFICGGSGGVGSVTWGGLRERGNLIGARVVTLEDKPRIVKLRGDRTNLINRTYGATGIVTELELPLQPAIPWRDLVIEFDTYAAAAHFGQDLANHQAIEKKLVTAIDWPLPSYFKQLAGIIPEGKAIVIAMVSPAGRVCIDDLTAQHGGRLIYDEDAVAAEMDPERTPLFEFTWNHTTLQVLKKDRYNFTYLQSLFPIGRNLEAMEEMRAHFGDEVMMHAEFIRFDGAITNSALQVVRYTTAERLNEIMAYHEAHGVLIANPHVVTVEDGSRHKRVPGDQVSFKHEVDPMGLLNPGKMRSFAVGKAAE
ncbi:MAG TPA: FAD-binding oxidoreductase [Magnetospirillaceae bacterium]